MTIASQGCALAVALVLVVGSVDGRKGQCGGPFYNIEQHENFSRLPMDTCGENNGDRIVGGQAASLGEFPWMVRIGYKLENCTSPVDYRCGGALITPNVVITAAHCSTKLPINRCASTKDLSKYYPFSVRLGEHILKTDPDCLQGVCAEKVQDIEISDVIVNPKYDTPKLQNDIAILKLKTKAVFNGWVNALCMVTGSKVTMQVFLNHTGIVAGWGITNVDTKETSKELQKLFVPVVPIADCIEAFDKKATLSRRKQMCAGGNKGQDSCTGDSGGPLFIIHDTDTGPKYNLLGIVSFGYKKCADRPLPAVYTNILYYLKWIMDNL